MCVEFSLDRKCTFWKFKIILFFVPHRIVQGLVHKRMCVECVAFSMGYFNFRTVFLMPSR